MGWDFNENLLEAIVVFFFFLLRACVRVCACMFDTAATLSRYDASKELRQLTGETKVSEIKAEQVEKVSEHFDMQYDDDADDAVAAFWVDDVESLKIPLSAEETKALDDRRIPFGSISGFLKMMAAHQVAPTEDIFSLLMQCQLCGITQGPLQAHAGQTLVASHLLLRLCCVN